MTKPKLVAARERRNARASAVANPPLGVDAMNVLLPGLGAYGVTRAATRIVHGVVSKRAPRWGRHAHAASGVIAFAGVWLLGHRIQRLARYHDAIVMGAGIAAFQGLAQAYLPARYRWLFADPAPGVALPVVRPVPIMPAAAPAPAVNEGDDFSDLDEPDEYAQLEEQLRALEGATSRRRRPRKVNAAQRVAVGADDEAGDDREDPPVRIDPDLAEELGADEGVDDLYTGAFQN